MAFEQYVEYFMSGVFHLFNLFLTFALFELSNSIKNFGFEMTQLRVSQFPFLVFFQVKMDAYDA